jgi:CRP-like cAMP-binding protein
MRGEEIIMAPQAVFSGNLSYLNLPDILQILGANTRTGILRLARDTDHSTAAIYFENGNPVNATMGQLAGRDALYGLLGWAEGQFEFHERKRLVGIDRVIKESGIQISLNAMKMLDEGKMKKAGGSCFGKSPIGNDLSKRGGEGGSSVIKGPPIDFMYILEEKKFHDGAKIVAEGGYGNWIWVVLDGIVQISRETPKGTVKIIRLGEGCFIGTLLCLLHSVNQRSATVTAVGDVQVGILDTQRLAGDFSCLSPQSKALLSSFTRRLNKVTEQAINQPHGHPLIQGEKGFVEQNCFEEAFVIKEGEAHVARQAASGFLPLFTLGKRDVFGHVPFMDIGHEPYCATILGSRDLKTEPINITSIKGEYEQLPSILRNLIHHGSNCILETTKMAYHQ